LAGKLNNHGLLKACYNRLSNFYNLNKLFAKATRYKLMQRDQVRARVPIDSTELMWTEYDLQVIDINSDNNSLNEKNTLNILDFARRNKNQRLMNYEIALYRSHLIEAEKIGELKDLYHRRFPGEWARLASGNPGMYFRLKAVFFVNIITRLTRPFYFNKAERILESDGNMILRSKFYNRFGQFLLPPRRQGKSPCEVYHVLPAGRKGLLFEYMVIASGQLETLMR